MSPMINPLEQMKIVWRRLRGSALPTMDVVAPIVPASSTEPSPPIEPAYANPQFRKPGHFYSPVVDRAEAAQHLATVDPHVRSLPGIRIDQVEMAELWNSLVPFLHDIPFRDGLPSNGFRYTFTNDLYSWADASVLYAMLRFYRPKRMVEIGCGWSSACTLDTAERYLDKDFEITFIEPYPELLQGFVGDTRLDVRILNVPVQKAPMETFEKLQAGDFLFIDSTHVLKTGSDVCFELFEILPRLRRGVHVHFHDVFWPFEYPHDWAVVENRSWNELYALRAFLYENAAWKVEFFNSFFVRHERALIERSYPDFLRNSGGAIWLVKV